MCDIEPERFYNSCFAVYTDGQASKQYKTLENTNNKAFLLKIGKVECFIVAWKFGLACAIRKIKHSALGLDAYIVFAILGISASLPHALFYV